MKQKLCRRCSEYWPADLEFFHARKGGDGLNYCCKACYLELPSQQHRATRGKKAIRSFVDRIEERCR